MLTAFNTETALLLPRKSIHLSALILARNEERNLEECLKSLAGWCQDIHLLDSHSTDSTLEIARRYLVHVHQHVSKGIPNNGVGRSKTFLSRTNGSSRWMLIIG